MSILYYQHIQGMVMDNTKYTEVLISGADPTGFQSDHLEI
jgi:hypothetical protein